MKLRAYGTTAVLALLLMAPGVFGTEGRAGAPAPIRAFHPGETLSYDITWSHILTAGRVVLAVNAETTADGRQVLSFTAVGRSAGLVDSFYHVFDTVQSFFDPRVMQSLSTSIRERYGEKQRRREVVFDSAHGTVVSRVNEGPPETFAVPAEARDILSTLYYIRTREDLAVGRPISIGVHDGGRYWSVEVQTLGKEKVRTRAGEFATILIRTYPRYQGVFLNKGEVFLWLTDDSRRVPVLMKSKLAIGSLIFALTGFQPGGER